MTHKVLMIIPNADLRDLVIDLLEEVSSGSSDLEIDKEENLRDALARYRGAEPYSLVVSHIHIRAKRKSTLVEADKLGLVLLQTLAEEKSSVPAILLTPEVDDDQLSLLAKFPHISLALLGGKWAEQIRSIADRVLGDRSTDGQEKGCDSGCPPQKKIQVDLIVYPYSDTWAMIFKGEGDIICDPTPRLLKVNLAKLNDTLIKDGMIDRYRSNYPDWKIFLNDIGEVLVREILDKNPDVLNYYSRLSGQVGGCENFRVRFVTGEEAYPLNLEAILVPGEREKEDFWMLKAPVCRRLNVGDLELYPLFENPNQKEILQEINCLIIEADVHGLDKKLKIGLNPLENISQEAGQLEMKLEKMKEKESIGHIERIPKKGSGEECTKEAVEATLKNGRQWHMVHYAGHSHHTEKDSGYVFFSKNGRPDRVDIQVFAQWLRQARTRFIYLSSCESSKLKFVHELAKKAVPAVIGYRWDIEDDKAAEHANIFYDNLFREQSLEYAFLKTRQQVSQKCPEHIIWAAPVLVMQVVQN